MNVITFIRQYRVFNYAIFDLILAFVGMFLVAPLLSKGMRGFGVEVPEINWVILTLPISITVHLLVGSMTPMTKNFLDLSDHVVLKIVIIVTILIGLHGISLVK